MSSGFDPADTVLVTLDLQHGVVSTKQLKALGSSLSGRSGATNSVIGFDFTRRNSPANTGPAMIMAGIATMRPYSSVVAMSAPNIGNMAVGAGCGGRKPCVTDSEANIGMPR